MDEQQLMMVGAAICAALLVLAFTVLWLLRQMGKLKLAHQALSKQLQRSDADLAGLCSAAIAVDHRLADNESQLVLLAEKICLQQQQQQPSSATPVTNDQSSPELEGYAKAIQMIVRGASAEELVKSCGMTRDEAMLLISVNRAKGANS